MKSAYLIRKRYLLIPAIVVVVWLFLVTRSGDIELHSQRTHVLLELKGLDARLDRDVMQVTSFLLVQYDPFVQTATEIRKLSKTLRDPAQGFYTHTEPGVDQAIDTYLDTLEQKLAILERIKYQAAVVRNGLHYLPGVVTKLHAIDNATSDGLIEVLNHLFLYNLFPNEFDRQEILQQIRDLEARGKEQSGLDLTLLDNAVFHMRANLKGLTTLANLRAHYIAIPSTGRFQNLTNAYAAYHGASMQRSEWFNLGLLITTVLLLTLLGWLLRRLDFARNAAESAWGRLRDAVESISEAFALFDADGKLVLHNRNWLEFYPWLKGELRSDATMLEIREAGADHIIYEAVSENKALDISEFGDHDGKYLERLDGGRWLLASDDPTVDDGWACVRVDITESKQAEQELRKLERAMEQSPASVMITDTKGTIEYVNPRFEQISGYSAEEIIGQNPRILKSGDKTREEYMGLWETLTSGKEWKGYFHNRRKDGTIYWEAASISPLRGDDGIITHYIAVKEDITARKRAEDQLRMNATVFDTATEGILVTDANNTIKTINPAFTRITGYEPEDVIGLNPKVLASGRHDEAFYRQMWNQVETRGFWSGEIWNRRKDGSVYPEWLSIVVIPDEEKEGVNEYVAVFSDISQRKQDEEEIRRQANYDALTGLPNRSLFFDRLSQATQSSRRESSMLAILFVDLDRFKSVNDTFGHVMGDEILQEVGERLCTCVRGSDTVARLGGDEFVLLLHDLAEVNDAALVAEKIVEQMSLPFCIENAREVFLGASVGITVCPVDTDDPEIMMRNADMAMYRAKDAGRNRYQFFTVGMQEQVQERVELEQDLRLAVERNELQLYYQPIIASKTGQMSSVEALLRWIHPRIGIVSPETFIPLAEESGLIISIGDWVLREACRQLRVWRDSGINIGMSINVSSRQRSKELNPWVLSSILKEYDIRSEWLTLEITEGLLMDDSKEVIGWLNGFKELGVSLSIDDFGTGYSSLSYLKRFPVDVLKIDRSFVHDLPDNQEDASLVDAILAMGHSLGLKVVAEGVETQEQHHFLRERGCGYLQGYYFGRPMPAQQLEAWLDARNAAANES
jgi:diguanylate cyclase (GGDEF)-like protein/PAS domain S-box-containing protein